MRKSWLPWLLLILLLAAALRLYGLNFQSLRNDELSSWWRSSGGTLASVVERAQTDLYPPGYHFVLFAVENTLGESEPALRLVSALAGILAVAAIFRLGSTLYSPREGLVAAALTAALWYPLNFSQDARAYSLLFLCSIASVSAWLVVVDGLGPGRRIGPLPIVAYMAVASFTSYLHYFGLLLMALQGVVAVALAVHNRRAFVATVAIYVAIGLSYVPWLPDLLVDARGTYGSEWLPRPGLADLWAMATAYFNNSGEMLALVLAAFAWLAASRLLPVNEAGHNVFLGRVTVHPDVFLALWLVVPIGLAYVRSQFGVPILTYQNLIVSAPAVYLLLARSLAAVPWLRRGAILGLAVVGVVCVLLVHLLFKVDYYTRAVKPQFREATRYIIEREQQYPDSVVVGYVWSEEYLNYYFRNQGSGRRCNLIAGVPDDMARLDEYLAAARPNYMWYVFSARYPDQAFLDYLHDRYEEVEHKPLAKAGVFLFDLKSAPPGR